MNIISQTVPCQFDTPFSPFKASEFEYALDYLSGAGFTGVELAIAHPADADPDKLLRLMEKYSLRATTLSTGQAYGLDGVYMASDDERIRGAAIRLICGHVELAERIGGCPVTIGLLRGKLEKLPAKALLENFKEAMKPCIDCAGKRGVTLQIEPICRRETSIINSTRECLDFISGLGNPGCVGVLYDTYHSCIEDGDMLSALSSAAKQVTNVHFSDRDRGLPRGGMDFGSVCSILEAAGYEGAFALETLSIPSADYVRENCYASIAGIVRPGGPSPAPGRRESKSPYSA